jgi:hypothetical protein
MGLFNRMKEAQQQAAQAMGAAGGASAATMGGDMAAQAAYAQLANKLGASGVEAPGVIKAITPTGQTDMGGGQQTNVDVTISPVDGAPYDTTVSQSFLPAQLEGLAVGGSITVKYDPDNPSAALIYGW